MGSAEALRPLWELPPALLGCSEVHARYEQAPAWTAATMKSGDGARADRTPETSIFRSRSLPFLQG